MTAATASTDPEEPTMTEAEAHTPVAEDATDLEPEPAAADAASDVDAGQSPAAEPQPEPEPEPATEVAGEPDPIVAAIEHLDDRLEESQRLLARQTEIATSLHAENQRLKAGELARAQLPLVRDVIRVQDLLMQMLDATVESTAAGDLELAREAILDALARNGIETTQVAEGDAMDPRQHRIVGVLPIDAASADRTIAEVVKAGFVWDETTTIRPAEVRVYKHTPAPPAEDVTASDAPEPQS
jgi:molecular chaperone GrpE (heat shock protein)